MIKLSDRINAFVVLGKYLNGLLKPVEIVENNEENPLKNLITEIYRYNAWFNKKNVRLAIEGIALSLTESNLTQWCESYKELKMDSRPLKRVGVVMAGNIPLVGFHDFLSVLISGNKFVGKLSSDDNRLLPAIAKKLIDIETRFHDYIEFTEERLSGFDAIIATGGNNTSRYFEYYFGKYPHIIRKNRNGVAILSGNESTNELELLGKDIFHYFGMGCRSISKIFVPENYTFNCFFKAIESYRTVIDHHKYKNNYEYYRSIYLINQVKHFDNGFLMISKNDSYASPPSVLYFEYYKDIQELNRRLISDEELIQCVVGNKNTISTIIPFGKAQQPDLWDYADGVDTIEFLINL